MLKNENVIKTNTCDGNPIDDYLHNRRNFLLLCRNLPC